MPKLKNIDGDEAVNASNEAQFDAFDGSPEPVAQQPRLAEASKTKVNTPDLVAPAAPPVSKEETANNNFIPINNDLLPTKGIFYKGRKLSGRTLKVIELKKLSNISSEDAADVVNKIMEKVINGVPWNEIKLADKQALIFWVRCNTFRDPRFTLGFSCNLEKEVEGETKTCGCENKLSFSLEDVEYEYIKPEKLQDDYSVKVTLPFSEDELVWDYPSNADVELIEANFKKLKQIANLEKLEEPDYGLVSYACITRSINGNENLNVAAKYAYFSEQLAPADYIFLENTMEEDYACGIKQFIDATCKECGGTVSVPVMFSEEFFNPTFVK